MSETENIWPLFALPGALVLFAAMHLLPVLPRAKARVKEALGRSYLPLFISLSLVSVILLGWLWAISPFVPLYDPPAWGAHATFTLMFPAFLLFGIFLHPCRLKRLIRAPFALAVMFWGAGHLLANGDVATVMLAGGLAIIAAVMFALSWKNDVRPTAHPRGALLDVAALLGGAILYVAMIMLHETLIGVPVLPYVMPG